MSRTALYRYYDNAGDLLYVGISVTPWSRWKQHKAGKDWAEDVVATQIEWFDSRPAALAAESKAIVAEEPRYNVQHSVLTTVATSPAPSLFIAVECSECGRPIEDGDGYLEASLTEAEHHEQAIAEMRARNGTAIPVNELAALPDPAIWYAWHQRCDPGPDDEGYVIAVESIRTLADLFDWISHLSDKPWVMEHTNWTEMLRELADGTGPLVIEASFLNPEPT